MQRFAVVLLVGLIASGCGAGAPNAAPPAFVQQTIVTVTPGPVSMTEFTASDQSLVGRTGRPQVIEFFAFW